MKKLLLIALVVGGLTLVAAPRSDAQVYFSVGYGFPGYYGHYPYGIDPKRSKFFLRMGRKSITTVSSRVVMFRKV